MMRRKLGIVVLLALVSGYWLWPNQQPTPNHIPLTDAGSAPGLTAIAATELEQRTAANIPLPQTGQNQASQQAMAQPAVSQNQRNFAALFLPSADDRQSRLLRLRATAIQQANELALAELPSDVARLLAELNFAEAQVLLDQLARTGRTGADRLLVSMIQQQQRQRPCLPYTEYVAPPIPVRTQAAHEQQLRETLQVVPADIASVLTDTPVLFEQNAVMAACGELTADIEVSLERILLAAATDDENRLFIERYADLHRQRLPPRSLDANGEPRPAYSRAVMLAISQRLLPNYEVSDKVAEQYGKAKAAALEAEAFPPLFGRAAEILLFPFVPEIPPDRQRAMAYLAQASDRGELAALQSYSIQLLRIPGTAQRGYMFGLFTRHLNARGCFPGDYLAVWGHSYRNVEPNAQAMSPVTLDVVREDTERYIKANGPAIYKRLHCQ